MLTQKEIQARFAAADKPQTSVSVTIKLDSDDLSRLKRLCIGDTDTADKHALTGILWAMAEKAGICDSRGELL